MKIIDNCLENSDFQNIKEVITGSWFPWYVNPYILHPGEFFENENDRKYQFQFTHTFYDEFTPKSEFLELIKPIIKKLDPLAIVRIKANLNTITNKQMRHKLKHIDIPNFEGKTAIYYVNTNNGYTLFETGEEVQSVENRLVIFNAKTMHSGITSTDSSFRYVINFNYYDKEV